jgi:hypothetical protein
MKVPACVAGVHLYNIIERRAPGPIKSTEEMNEIGE